MLITLGRGLAPESQSNASSYTPSTIDYYVILLAGQSNMASRGTPINPAIDTTDPRILQLERTVATGADVSNEGITLASDPLDHIGKTPNSVGMGMSFAKQLLTTIPATSKVLLVPCAEGSTGFNGDDWNIGDPNYEDAIARANHAMSLGNNVFAGTLWHQGEQEGATPDYVHTARLDTLIATMRDRINGAVNSPFIVGDLKDNGGTPTFVRKSLNEIKTRVPYCGFAASTGLTFMPDNLHFDAASQREFGSVRYWNEYNINLTGDLGMSAPTTPTLTATNDEDGQSTLTVTPDSLGGSIIRHIIVRYKLSSATLWEYFHRKADGSTTITVDGLTNDSAYDFDVQIVTSAGVSPPSVSVSAIPTASSGGARAPANSLVSGAVFDVSARNSNSYDGTSQTLTNLGSGPDLWLGDDGSVDGHEPLFNGTAGDSAAEFSFPTSTRRFTAKAVTTLTNNLHRSDSTQDWTILFHLKAAFTYKSLLATAAHGGSAGFILWHGGNKLRIRNYNTSGGVTNTFNTTQTYSNAVDNLIAFTFDASTRSYTYKVNNETLETGTVPAWANTTTVNTPPVLLADTAGNFSTVNPSRFHDFIMYDKVLSETEINSLFTLMSSSKT